ncbi:hypothetical protein Tco_0143589 [Tanacetum coccineum]
MGQIPNVKDKRIDSWDKVQHGRVIPHQTRPIGPIPTRNDAMLDDEEHNGMLGISTESTPSEVTQRVTSRDLPTLATV